MEIIHISIVGIVAILSLIFGIRVYIASKTAVLNKAFSVFTFITAIWLILDFATYQQSLAIYQTLIYRVLLAVIVLLLVSLTYFIHIFPKPLFILKNYQKIILVLFTGIVILLILFTNFFVESTFMESYGANFKQGILFNVFTIYDSLLVIYCIVTLIIKYRKFVGEEKRQIKYILYGIGIFLILNATFNWIVPILLTKSFVYGRFGTYSAIFLVGFTAYAILKTHLFNMKIILTETAVVILNVISVVQIFTTKTAMEGLLRALFAVFIFYGSYLLLGSVKREIKFREELQQMTEQLAHANAHLKELDEMKTEFVSLASHELLTPVSAIEGYLSMLLDEKMAKVEDPKAQRYMERVYTSAKRLARLVTDMLNVSRIEEGRLLVQKQDINLSDLIQQVIDEIKFKAEEKKQTIKFEEPPFAKASEGVSTYGDPDKLKEVIINIIGNSIKYSKEPGTITVRIEKVPTEWVKEKWQKIEEDIKARPLDDQEAINSALDEHFRNFVGRQQLMISVQDQGIGIPKEELPRLFKKFHRVGDYTTAESQGTGLGLYISRALVELHHGRIWADSEGPSHGSTFTFSLPDIASKDEIIAMEKEIPQDKEQLKPLAKPVKEAEEL